MGGTEDYKEKGYFSITNKKLRMRVGSHSEEEGSPSVAFFVGLRPLDGLVNQTERNTKN